MWFYIWGNVVRRALCRQTSTNLNTSVHIRRLSRSRLMLKEVFQAAGPKFVLNRSLNDLFQKFLVESLRTKLFQYM